MPVPGAFQTSASLYRISLGLVLNSIVWLAIHVHCTPILQLTLTMIFSEMFSHIIEKHAPLIEMRVSEKYCPWIDKDLKDLMCTRDKLKNQQSKLNTQFLWTLTERSAIRSMPLMFS